MKAMHGAEGGRSGAAGNRNGGRVCGGLAIDARGLSRDMRSGIQRYTVGILRALAAVDHPFELHVVVDPARQPVLPALGHGMRVLESPVPYLDVRRSQRFGGFLARQGIGAVHLPEPLLPLLHPGLSYAVTIHDLIPLRCRHLLTGTVKARLSPLWRINLACIIRRAKAVITPSHFSRSDIARSFPGARSKTWAIHNAVEAPVRSAVLETVSELPLDRPFFLFVGRPDPHKNITLLIKALARLPANRSTRPRLLIVGKRDERYTMPDRMVDRLALDGDVLFLSGIDDAQLDLLYRRALAVLMPSFYEGFGYPPVESLLRGTAVLASHSSCLPEVLEDLAHYFDPHDDRALAALMRKVIDDPGDLAPSSEQRQALAERFSFEVMGRRLTAAFASAFC